MDFSWVTEHPLVTGAVVIGGGLGLYLVLHRGASGTDSTSAAGSSIAYRGPSDQVQAAAIQAGTQIQLAQAAVLSQNNTAQYALASQTVATQGQLDLAVIGQQSDQNKLLEQLAEAQLVSNTAITTQANAITGATNIAQIDAITQRQGISAQQTIGLAQIDASLAGLRDTNAAGVQVAQIGAAGTLGLAQIQAGTDMAAISAKLQAYTLQTQLQHDVIAGTVEINQDQLSLLSQQLTQRQGLQQSVVSLLQSGQINKGGEGGANQVSVLGGLLGTPGIGTSAQQTAALDSAAEWGFFNNIAKIGGDILTGLF